MIRPPSNVLPYDDFYSGDSAIIPAPADKAPETERSEYDAKIARARETGVWAEIVVEGQIPTAFTMQPIEGDVYRTLIDMSIRGVIGPGILNQLAFRAAVQKVTNLGTVEIKKRGVENLGMIATVDIANTLDRIDKRIVSELGGEVLRRAREVSPK